MEIHSVYQQTDTWKTLIEHEQIILTYKNTGKLNREHALSVYRNFSIKHPGYMAQVAAETAILQNGIDLAFASDAQIVNNLNRQVLYLSGKSLLETLLNGS